MHTSEVLDRLQSATGRPPKKTSADSWQANCPAHADKTASLSVREAQDGKTLLCCHAGCGLEEIVEAAGLKKSDLFADSNRRNGGSNGHGAPRSNGGSTQRRKVSASYPYRAEQGNPLYRIQRTTSPKGFFQQRYDEAKQEYVNGLGDARRVLYRLPELLEAKAQGKWILLTEGEKDVHSAVALGFTATCNCGGAGKWRREYTETLRGSRVVVLPDNDRAGRDHAELVANALYGVAAEVRIVELPGLPEKGDLTDWVKAGGSREELIGLVMAAPPWEPSDADTDAHGQPDPADVGEPDTRPLVANYEPVQGGKIALPIARIRESVLKATDGQPRRVGPLLFAEKTETGVRYLETPEAFTAWMHERARLRWSDGRGQGDQACVSRREIFEHFRATAEAYDAVEEIPHEPPMPRTYYVRRPNPTGDADGSHLERLCSFFPNVETPFDRIMLRAFFITPLWGGLPGTRPAFVILANGPNSGKTTATDAAAELFGGAIEIEPNGANQEKIVSRLLAPAALPLRLIRQDNVRSMTGGSLIESLVTMVRFSGHRMYHGEAQRLNTLCWAITGNSLRLPRDMADRSMIVRLRHPEPISGWREAVMQFVADHRDQIIADGLAILKREPLSPPAGDRWQSWVDGVLRRVTDRAPQVLAQNQDRRNVHDQDRDEAETIADALRQTDGIAWDSNGSAFVPAARMLEIVNTALGVNWSAKAVANHLQTHIDAGRLEGWEKTRTMNARGYTVKNGGMTDDAYDA